MFCGKCGSFIPDTAGFCPKCGSATGKYVMNSKQSLLKTILIIWFVVLILFLGLLIGGFVYQNHRLSTIAAETAKTYQDTQVQVLMEKLEENSGMEWTEETAAAVENTLESQVQVYYQVPKYVILKTTIIYEIKKPNMQPYYQRSKPTESNAYLQDLNNYLEQLEDTDRTTMEVSVRYEGITSWNVTDETTEIPTESNIATEPNAIVAAESSEVTSSMKEQMIQAVLDQETEWMAEANTAAGGKSGSFSCWFQDLNMDGTLEFIIGGTTDYWTEDTGSAYVIYSYQNGEWKKASFTDEIYFLLMWDSQRSQNGSYDFCKTMQLLKNNTTGSYFYTAVSKNNYTSSSGGVEFMDQIQLKTSGDSVQIERGRKIVYFEVDENGTPNGDYTHIQSGACTVEELLSTYDAFFADVTPYQTTIQGIPCTESSKGMDGYYDTMTIEEKRAALSASYDAWSYQEDAGAALPLEEQIQQLRELAAQNTKTTTLAATVTPTEATTTTVVKVTEDDLKAKVSDQSIVGWFCEDFNGDGNLEAFCMIGTKTDSANKIQQLLYVNAEGVQVLREDFWGDFGQGRIVEYDSSTKYFVLSTDNGGSGSIVYVYYVYGTSGREASCSGQLNGFAIDEGGLYAFGENGSTAHEGTKTYLTVNPDTKDVSF